MNRLAQGRWFCLLAACGIVAAVEGCGGDTGVVVVTYLQGRFPLDSIEYQIFDPEDQAVDGSVAPVTIAERSVVGRDLSEEPFRFLILRNGSMPEGVRVLAYAYTARGPGNERPVAFGWDTFKFKEGELLAYRLDLWPASLWGEEPQP